MPDELSEECDGSLEAAYLCGNEDEIIAELRNLRRKRTRRDRRAATAIHILEQTRSSRVRNAAALALADMRITGAKDRLIDILKKPESKEHSGTILYALDELGVNLPSSVVVDLVAHGSYEAREEALSFLASGRIDYDKDRRHLRQEVRRALQAADEDSAHALNTALKYLSSPVG